MNLTVREDSEASYGHSLGGQSYWVWPFRISSSHRWLLVGASVPWGGSHVGYGVYNIVVKSPFCNGELTGFQAHLSHHVAWVSYF